MFFWAALELSLPGADLLVSLPDKSEASNKAAVKSECGPFPHHVGNPVLRCNGIRPHVAFGGAPSVSATCLNPLSDHVASSES